MYLDPKQNTPRTAMSDALARAAAAAKKELPLELTRALDYKPPIVLKNVRLTWPNRLK